MLALKNILAATDFSGCSATAMTYARALAGASGAKLHVLHAVEPVLTEAVIGVSEFAAVIPQLQEDVSDAVRAQLEASVTDDDRWRLGATTVLRTFEAPAQAIVDYAKEHKIDLIVIGTRGRTGLSHFVLGSVAEKVVRTAPCPVLTVHQGNAVSAAGDAAA